MNKVSSKKSSMDSRSYVKNNFKACLMGEKPCFFYGKTRKVCQKRPLNEADILRAFYGQLFSMNNFSNVFRAWKKGSKKAFKRSSLDK